MSEKRAERDELWAKWKVANSLSKEISDKLSVRRSKTAWAHAHPMSQFADAYPDRACVLCCGDDHIDRLSAIDRQLPSVSARV